MRKFAVIAMLVFIGVSSVAIQAQQGRIAQIVPPTATVYKEADLNVLNVGDLIQALPVQAQTVTLSQTRLMKGARSPHHNHPEEELIVVITGRLRVMTPEGDVMAEPGDVVVVESYAEHQFEALEDTYMVEAFGPGRVIGGGG